MNYAWFKVVNHKYSLYNDVLINSLNIKIALLLKFPNLIFFKILDLDDKDLIILRPFFIIFI